MGFSTTIHIPLVKNPLSLNSRMHWSVKARHTKQWREYTRLNARNITPMHAIDVTLTWVVNDRRRRDEDNLYLLIKAMCDGLVDAGLVEDDTYTFMGKRCRIDYQADSKPHMELHIEERQEGS